jgi:hypothetical protein
VISCFHLLIGLKTGAFVIYDALLTAVTSSGTLVALLIIVAAESRPVAEKTEQHTDDPDRYP